MARRALRARCATARRHPAPARLRPLQQCMRCAGRADRVRVRRQPRVVLRGGIGGPARAGAAGLAAGACGRSTARTTPCPGAGRRLSGCPCPSCCYSVCLAADGRGPAAWQPLVGKTLMSRAGLPLGSWQAQSLAHPRQGVRHLARSRRQQQPKRMPVQEPRGAAGGGAAGRAGAPGRRGRRARGVRLPRPARAGGGGDAGAPALAVPAPGAPATNAPCCGGVFRVSADDHSTRGAEACGWARE